MEAVLFYILASITIVSALLVILAKNPMHNAIWLIVTLLSLAGIYILLNAEFVAALQIIIYAGAVIVLIMFAVFIINFEKDEYGIKWHMQTPYAYLIGIVLFFEIGYLVKKTVFEKGGNEALSAINEIGNSEAVSAQLFSKYLLPFEIASVLLLAAMVGAIVIARKEKEE